MIPSPCVPVLVVAGVSSGVGKTTITLGILEAVGRRGLVVQAFKVGHEFHRSTLDAVPHEVARAYSISGARGETVKAERYTIGGALMSYVHLRFGSNPSVARSFVSACARR